MAAGAESAGGEPASVRVVVDRRLRIFLRPAGARPEGERVVRIGPEPPTVGHVVQSAGVPLTEVGQLSLNGEAVWPGVRTRPGRLDVRERGRPQRTPTAPPRFVCDVHLGALARRLRLLGLDVAYGTDRDDAELVETSLAERRVLLTRDRGLLMRRAARWAAYVRGQRLDDQLADVLDRFAPALRPWTRCVRCNGLLRPAACGEVADLLEAGTRRTYADFARCTSCGRPYWRGAHARRLEAAVAAAQAVLSARDADRAR